MLSTRQNLIAIDEVGRGALAGPVAVGAFFLSMEHLAEIPEGLRDSKLIAEKNRRLIAERVEAWGQSSVGFASSAEIEEHGITKALALAAGRAIALLPQSDLILLDGSHNWLGGDIAEVIVQTKADRDCASVSAASVVAKVARDSLMSELSEQIPHYQFEKNKGYSSPAHIQALRELGPSQEHRLSWLGKLLSPDQTLF